MDKKWALIIFSIYLALACLISGIASVSVFMDIVDNILDIIWPNPQHEDISYYTPMPLKEVVRDIIGLALVVPIFIVHLMMFRKEVKK